ncbi:MAG TPA: Gfo/Idh/MocA family oxidoreductase, partial [Armatimonadota bacterium]|nr:Gfo/Idh/MocA family oxidoreductase [Armatimonadota bacterium]
MSERKLGAAIIGAGWVSTEHIRAYQQNPHVDVVAIGSRRESTAKAKAEECGLPDAAIYTDIADLVADERVDVLSVTSPSNVHAEQVIAAAEAGKHMIIEKAVANTLEDIKAMRDAVRAAKVKTVVSFVLRWNPSLINTKALLDAGAIGDVFYGEVDYWHGVSDWYSGWPWAHTVEGGGSSMLFAGCHAADALRWFCGDVAEVSAFAGGWDKRWEYPPTVVGAIKFESGAVGKLSSSVDIVAPYQFNIDVLGSEGAIRDNKLYSKTMMPGQSDFAEIPTVLPNSGDVEHHPFVGEIDEFIDCVLGDTESQVNLEDAVKTHELCIAMDRSAEADGEPVKLPLLED